MVEKLKSEWFNQPRKNILAGIVVALALIPEAIAFSIIAGVDPMVGLYAAFIIATVISAIALILSLFLQSKKKAEASAKKANAEDKTAHQE